jgi:hypothetical protein
LHFEYFLFYQSKDYADISLLAAVSISSFTSMSLVGFLNIRFKYPVLGFINISALVMNYIFGIFQYDLFLQVLAVQALAHIAILGSEYINE